MKTIATTIILAMILSINVNAQNTSASFIWGASAEKTILEDDKNLNEFISSDNIKVVSTTIYGMKASKFYYFHNNELVKVTYIIKEKFENSDDCINYYNKLTNKISKNYGQPVENNTIWYSENCSEDYGLAVIAGDLDIESTYNADNSIVKVKLEGGNSNIRLAMELVSKEYSHIEVLLPERRGIEML